MNKNILITGTSTGVGFESALLFARKGYKVYATMRNLGKATPLKEAIASEQLDIEILELDVTQPDTIKTVVDHILKQDKRIDVLLNNAGAGFAKTTEQATVEEINWVTDVNYMGVVHCTKAVLPHMREQQAGHIITVTSVGGLVGQPFNEFYCAAKFAVEGYIEALAGYVGKAFSINFSLIEPGGIATEFMKSAVSKTVTDGQLATGPYQAIMERYLAGAQERSESDTASLYQTPLEVAEVIAAVAQAEEPPLRKRTSAWAEDLCHFKTAADPDGTKLLNKVHKQFL